MCCRSREARRKPYFSAGRLSSLKSMNETMRSKQTARISLISFKIRSCTSTSRHRQTAFILPESNWCRSANLRCCKLGMEHKFARSAAHFVLSTLNSARCIPTYRKHDMRAFSKPHAVSKLSHFPSSRIVQNTPVISIQRRRFSSDSIATNSMSKSGSAKNRRMWWKECVVYQVI